MSIELAEAYILSRQMNETLRGKQIQTCQVQNCQNLQKIGCVNKDTSAFERLIGGSVESVVSRGNVILVKLDNDMNLLLAPEYGGRIQYHTEESTVPKKFHLKLGFNDNAMLTVTLTGVGFIQTLNNNELIGSYAYKRDFSQTASPTNAEEFTYEHFASALACKNVNVKHALVGKDAVIVGLSNSTFQDVIYRAKIHPKRKASDLDENEKHALYDAIALVVKERIQGGGKNQFTDLYGKQGRYTPAMGPNMKDHACPACGAGVEKLSLGGGQVYFCPKCQT
jgi:formamidopyrimidine-DNA glycosylase